MKILVTGGAGFIGSHLADSLLSRGDEVLVVDNYATGRHDNLKPQDRLEVVEGTIADEALVEDLVSRFTPDVVVHAAASYKDPDDWHEDTRTNVLGSANVAKSAAANGCKRLIYFQTALCYGVLPIEQPITLDHPLRPLDSSYAITKTAGEHFLALSGVDFVSFRLANAYGPRNLSGPLPTFYHRLTEDKPIFVMDTRRDFVYIDDLVACVLKAIDGTGSGYYHISSGSDFSIKELYAATRAALGLEPDEEVEVRPRGADDAYTILLDPSRTITDFDWGVEISLVQGVQAAVDYYREYGISETFTHLRMPAKE